MEYREMRSDEIKRISEVKREEIINYVYTTKCDDTGFGLVTTCVEKSPPGVEPPWGEKGVEHRINNWKPSLQQGGCMYGAFDNDRLVGFVILGPKREDNSGEIVAIFIDKDYRRIGIAGKLMKWAEKKAKSLEMESLFLYSNPTGSAMGFYLNQGFRIVGLISKEIVRSLPGDIVMAKKI
ncbi:MAG: GNAT family N-acetyltransferase [Candidatus Cloacimonetes bacterium]|nr:GNAT family N-acetyltransferase [Candidatus Cloacimonadota bacterium]